jgi:hypothetical protein
VVAVEELVGVVGVVEVLGVVEVVVRRDGAVGVICDEVVVVDPLASAPAGAASRTPTEAMAAANLDFTGFRNVDERRVSDHPDALVRNMHAFSNAKASSLPSRREWCPAIRR